MKETFNYKKFRDETAESLIGEKDKEKRKQLLDDFKKSRKYLLAEELKTADKFVLEKINWPELEEWTTLHKRLNELGEIENSENKITEIQGEIEKCKEKMDKFVNQITNGAYLDSKNLNHVVGAYNEGGPRDATKPPENAIWFSAGENWFLEPGKDLLIFSHKNPLFSKFMDQFKDRWFEISEGRTDKDFKERLEKMKIVKGTEKWWSLPQAQDKYEINNLSDPDGWFLPYAYLNNLPIFTTKWIGARLYIDYGEKVSDKLKENMPSFEFTEFLKDMADYRINLNKGELWKYDPGMHAKSSKEGSKDTP